ncbi:xylulokinase [Terrimicrobium sacchariphilum]|uniref:Xylulose kinase n=1 Tax=Terrimicrobium sacchariphilum TaxID=690879 RepID=A0A146G8T6_TERSA|nr:xylulokinase [Terrimicrobium sacchariphilum]GAT33036.1 xylulokinase [Terrimicrobium sacchariphilum]
MILLGIDCGTQSTKTIAVDGETGAVLAVGQRSHAFVSGLAAEAAEQDPRQWVQALEESADEVMKKLGDRRREVAAIGVSGQQHGLVALDRAGTPVRPAKLWCDNSTVVQCEQLTAALGGPARTVETVGNSMRTGYTAPKILWLKQQEPENWNRTATVLLPHDYLNFFLTGKARMEFGDASGMALLDVRNRVWSEDAIRAIGAELWEKLPPLASSREPVGELREELRARWGLAHGVMVSAGGGDNMMAAIGTGNIRPGVVSASLGTSGTLFAYSSGPIIDPTGEIAGFCDSTDAWLPLVCTVNVTLVTEHVRNLFGWDHVRFEAEISKVPAGADGLFFLPYLTGERTPDLPQATGALSGMTLQNFSPAHLARAAVEGVTLGLGYGLNRLRSFGLRAAETRLTGGASKSAAWRQICADVFDGETVCLTTSEGAAMGAAIQAGATLAGGTDWGEALTSLTARCVHIDESTRCVPDVARRAVYQELQEVFSERCRPVQR